MQLARFFRQSKQGAPVGVGWVGITGTTCAGGAGLVVDVEGSANGLGATCTCEVDMRG